MKLLNILKLLPMMLALLGSVANAQESDSIKWLELAQQGDARAQLKVGLIYVMGEVVPVNYPQAVRWFTKSAEQGQPHAQFLLGKMYKLGEGVPTDHGKAVMWLIKSSEQGNGDAQVELSGMYALGLGVPRDFVRSYLWLDLAAEGGHKKAIRGRELMKGALTPEQIAQAHKLAQEFQQRRPSKN